MFSSKPRFYNPLCGNYAAIRLKNIFLGLVVSITAAACTPSHNWREAFVSDSADSPRLAKILLPGKPATMQRSIQLDRLSVKMTMMGAKVNDTTFTVAHATLPDAQIQTQTAALAAMRLQMVRNIQGTETEVSERAISIVDDSGRALGTINAQLVSAKGAVKGQALFMQAGFLVEANRVYQWVALGPQLDLEQTKTFMQSFRLLHK